MKKFLLIAVSIGIVLSLTTFFCVANTLFNGKNIKGSGNLITKTIDVPTFDGIRASRAVKVVITDNATDKIIIEADDNLMEYVLVKTNNGDLVVTMDNKLNNISNNHITVTVPANDKINSLKASSAADIQSTVLFCADEFELDASSAAKINASVKARKCDADASSAATIDAVITAVDCELNASSAAKIAATVESTSCSADASSAAKISATVKTTNCSAETSSAAKIDLQGSSVNCKANLSSGAKLNAEKFTVEDYDIGASSGSQATIQCNGVLTTSVSSGASIHFTGEPKKYNNHSSSGGRVSRL